MRVIQGAYHHIIGHSGDSPDIRVISTLPIFVW